MSGSAPRCFLIEMKISVRTYDIDFAGHVSNIVYLRWMEDMRWELFNRHFPLNPVMEEGFVPAIISTAIEYKKSVRLFDKPVGTMWIASVSHATLQFQGEIHLGEEVATRATHTGVFLDRATMKPRRLPPEFVKKYRLAQTTLAGQP